MSNETKDPRPETATAELAPLAAAINGLGRERAKHPVTGEDYEEIFRTVRAEKNALYEKNRKLHERAQKAEVERDRLRKVAEDALAENVWLRAENERLREAISVISATVSLPTTLRARLSALLSEGPTTIDIWPVD